MRKNQKEHDSLIIENRLNNRSLKSPVYLYGVEDYLIHWAVRRITETYVSAVTKELNHAVIDGEQTCLSEIINQCETLPLMSEKRVVIIGSFSPLANESLKDFTSDDEDRLAEYLHHLPKTCFLVFTGKKADKRLKLYKAIASAGGAGYDFTRVDYGLLCKFIVKRLAKAKKSIKEDTLRRFIGYSGYFNDESSYSLYNFDNDIKKLIAYSDEEEILFSHIEDIASCDALSYIFAMLDAVSERRKDTAIAVLHNLLMSGENEFKILKTLCGQMELTLTAKEMQQEGFAYEDMRKLLRVHPFRLQKAIQQSRCFTVDQLRRIQILAYEIEQNIKNGLLDKELAFEIFIAAV